MKKGESVSQMYGRFKEVINSLQAIGDHIEN